MLKFASNGHVQVCKCFEHGNFLTFIWKIYFYNFNEPSRVFNVLSGTLVLFNLFNVKVVFFSPCLSNWAFRTTLAYTTLVIMRC